jgi:hypothetical protein
VLLNTTPNLEIVTFADDIMIMIQGPSHSAVLTSVVNTPCTTEDWCKKHRLEISKDKSALMPMFIRKRHTYKSHPKISLWGLNVSKMKYLGIMLDCKMDWFPHTQYLENKLLHIRNNFA